MRRRVRREAAPAKLPIETINLVGPDTLTGPQVAAIWSDVLGRPIVYGGDDPSGFEQNMASFIPKWMAYEMRLMAERYVSDGMIHDEGDRERLTAILGRSLHAYRDFRRQPRWRVRLGRRARGERAICPSASCPSPLLRDSEEPHSAIHVAFSCYSLRSLVNVPGLAIGIELKPL